MHLIHYNPVYPLLIVLLVIAITGFISTHCYDSIKAVRMLATIILMNTFI